METHIKLHYDRFLHQQASRRVAVKRLCKRDLATTVCVEGVWMVVALFLIFWLCHICSKSAKRIKVCVPTSPSCSSEGGVVSEAVPSSPREMTVKSHDHLVAVSHQRLIMSGDVETNPGPLDQGRCI